MAQHELKFHQATKTALIARRRQAFKNSKSCQVGHDVFKANTEIAKSLLMVPGYSFWLGGVWQSSTDSAAEELCKTRIPANITSELANRLGARAEYYFKGVMANPQNDHNKAARCMTKNLEDILRKTLLHDALEGVLKAVVIQSWTAFEILVEQLLMMSLDGHAKCFPKEVHDVANKFRFRRMETIRTSYSKAFGSDPEIDALHEGHAIKACGLLRHLLVHKDGFVDETFIRQCAEPPVITRFARWKKDARIEVDGEMVYGLVDPLIHEGFRLIELVYAWIQAHKTRTP